MAFDSRIAAIRFGTGLSPRIPAPANAAAMLDLLGGPDRMARQVTVQKFSDQLPRISAYQDQNRMRRKADSSTMRQAAETEVKTMRRTAAREALGDVGRMMLRAILAEDGMRERLTAFWADHFTVVGKNGLLPFSVPGYIEEAIRPNITGRFADLLAAAVTHPMMLLYLDQAQSVGPDSPAAKGGKRGLNENLARELVELHTLGVDGAYTQDDVRQLAELLTGLTVRPREGFVFRPGMAEPGAETVLGHRYGGKRAGLQDIRAVLEDLAAHPDTARHIARKLAVHFVSDTPDPSLVDHVAAAYASSDGALMATYAALLEHPAAWDPARQKARQPFDFIVAALRALDIPQADLMRLRAAKLRRLFYAPMQAMGQQWGRAPGPDGWPEEAAHWITPAGMAARIEWAMKAPSALMPRLPNPRDFVVDALGGLAGADLLFAARAAETRADGVAIILVSPEFQRR